MSMFTDTPKGLQTLLDALQEFSTWRGMEINVKKTFLLVTDKDWKRRKSMPALDLIIIGKCVKIVDITDDTCLPVYLDY